MNFIRIYDVHHIKYLKAITLLLIISMIPLHKNKRHIQSFIKLLESKYLTL